MIIDTDTHLIDPPDIWTSRMSARKWGNAIPHVRDDPNGQSESWYVGDTRVASVGYVVTVPGPGGRATRFAGATEEIPSRFEHIHPSAYDAAERLKVMDEFGIQIAALYPNLGNMLTPQMHRLIDFDVDEYRLECIRVYNDFVLDWISPDPSRFIPLASMPYWDVQACTAEIERCAERGFKGIVTTGAPHKHGQPVLADRHWDPMWAAAQAHRMPISFHIGGGDMADHMNEERLAVEGASFVLARTSCGMFFDNAIVLNDLLFSGVLARFPELTFCMVESGVGWIPFCLEAADYHFLRADDPARRAEFDLLPSEYFRRQVYANYWFEDLEPWHVEKVGAQNIFFETDYPHPTCLFGEDVEVALQKGLANVGGDTRDDILWRNAAKLYGLELPTGL